MENKHLFCLYVQTFEIKKDLILIKNREIINRIIKILRLKLNENIIIFNDIERYDCYLLENSKDCLFLKINKIIVLLEEERKNITLYLPLLSKEYMESVFFLAGELGVIDIIIFKAEKSYNDWGRENDWIRAKKLIIAGAEISKRYYIPILHKRIATLDDVIIESKKSDLFLWINEQGENTINNLVFDIKNKKNIGILVAPEGGFKENEEEKIKFAYKMKLTSMILRSSDAINLILGIVNCF